MQLLSYKIIIGDDPGAEVFKNLSQYWVAAKELDENYFGPEFYWGFYQLGDFDNIDVSICKFELASTWRLKRNCDDFNKGSFIGVTAGIFFFDPESEGSYEQMKRSLNTFFEKRSARVAPFIVIALKATPSSAITEDQRLFIESNQGKVFEAFQTTQVQNPGELADYAFELILKELQPALVENLNIDRNFWRLELTELKKILFAEKRGIKMTPRHLRKRPTPETEKEGEKIVSRTQEMVAISPSGEMLTITKQLTESEIMELVKQGYQLPEWIVVPRHCPKCFNQNQRMIREVTDKTIVLMQNPPIYGTKYVCGNCGHSWN